MSIRAALFVVAISVLVSVFASALFVSRVWGGPLAGLNANDAIGAASLVITAIAFGAGCYLAFAGVRAYRQADRLEEQLEEADARLEELRQSRGKLDRAVETTRPYVTRMPDQFRRSVLAIRSISKQIAEPESRLDLVTKRLLEDTEKTIFDDRRMQARSLLETCDRDTTGVLLRELFPCLEILDASDIEYVVLAKRRFPRDSEIVALSERLIEGIRKRSGEPAG